MATLIGNLRGATGSTGPAGPTGADSVAPGATGPTGATGPVAVSADAGNSAALGTDSLVYVPLVNEVTVATVDPLPGDPTVELWYDPTAVGVVVPGPTGPTGPPGPNSITTTMAAAAHTPLDADAGKMFLVTSTGAVTITLPASSPIDFECHYVRYSTTTATVQFVGSGVNIRSIANLTRIGSLYGLVTVKKLSATEWLLFGDLGV